MRLGQAVVECAFCGRPARIGQRGTLLAIAGWEQKRTGGGANAIRGRVETGAVAHETCLDARLHDPMPEAML